MEKKQIEEYLKRLVDIDKQLDDTDENNINPEIFGDIDEIINQLGNGVKTHMTSTDEFSMEVNYKKLSPDAVTPAYSKDGDAGLDFVATRIIDETIKQITYTTDIAVEIPKGYVGLLFSRSSVRNYELILSNCVGVIDSTYRGPLMATYNKTHGDDSEKYEITNKIFQLIILPYPKIKLVEKDTLSETERGTGGYGSSGK